MTEDERRLRGELESRRHRLEELTSSRPQEHLVDLLRRVDEALERVGRTEWGVCTVCQEPVEPERLEREPLVEVCLGCLSLEARRALEDDLEGAARVQRALLPPAELVRDGWEIGWIWEPLGVVSGDHLDVVAGPSRTEPTRILFGDVVGKGIPASMLQSHLHALARAFLSEGRDLGEVMEEINHHFCLATVAASYATLVAIRLFEDGRVEMVNAGHPRALFRDARGARPVEGADLPVGLFCEARFGGRELRLSEGEDLLLYTDGWTEATRDGEEFGIGRAAAALRRSADGTPAEMVRRCRDAMDRFLDGSPRSDDLTLMAIRRTGDPEQGTE